METAKDPTRTPGRSRKTNVGMHHHPPLSIFASRPECIFGSDAATRPVPASLWLVVAGPGCAGCGAAGAPGAPGDQAGRRRRAEEPRPFPSREGWIFGEETLDFQLCVELLLLFQGAQSAAGRFSRGGVTLRAGAKTRRGALEFLPIRTMIFASFVLRVVTLCVSSP